MPVLPEVGSRIVEPGLIRPRFSHPPSPFVSLAAVGGRSIHTKLGDAHRAQLGLLCEETLGKA